MPRRAPLPVLAPLPRTLAIWGLALLAALAAGTMRPPSTPAQDATPTGPPAAEESAPVEATERNFWDLGEPAHTEEHAQGLTPEADPAPAGTADEAPPEAAATPAEPTPPAQPEQPPAARRSPDAPGPAQDAAPTERAAAAGPAPPAGGEAAAAGSQAEPPADAAAAAGSQAEPPEARSLDQLYRMGQAAVRRGAVEQAERHFKAVLRRTPYHLLAHVGLGRLYLERNPRAAREHLETARRVFPSSHDVHYLLGQAYEALGRSLDAAEAYRRAIHLNPRHYDANARLRQLLRELRGRRSVVERAAESFYAQPSLATLTLFGRLVMEHLTPREAVLEFEQVRRRQPELVEADLWLARAYHAQDDMQGELAAYRRYLAARPDAAGVRLLVVERLAERGWYQNAAALLEPFTDGGAAALPPDARARVTFLRSRLLSTQDEPGRAATLLRRAHEQGYAAAEVERAFAEDLALYPDAPDLWLTYGRWLRAVQRPREAADALARAGLLDGERREEARTLLGEMRTAAGRNGGGVAARLALGELAWADGAAEDALAHLAAVPAGHALDPRAALLRGKIHRARGELDAALDAFTRYVFAFGDRRDVLYARGNLFWELGRREEAVAVWMEHPDVLARHPTVLASVARHHRAQGDTAAEIATREQLAEAVPGLAPNRIRLGELYAQQGRHAEAARLWERVLEERPRDADLLARTGQLWLALGERGRALPLLERASQLRSLDAETSLLLARELYRTHRYESALQAYWTLYRSRPEHPDLPRVLPELVLSLPATAEQRRAAARLAQEGGRLDQAAELLEAVLNAEPEDSETRLALAGLYLRLDRVSQAEAVLNDPAAPETMRPRGLELMERVQERLGQRAALAETLAELQALRPHDTALVRRRGLLLAELQRPAEARPLLEQALEATPDDPALTLALAEVAMAVNDADAAEAHLQALLRRQPEHGEARRRLIDLLLREERWEEAATRLEAWVDTHPEDAGARYNLVTAYLKTFDKDAALPHFQALERLNPRRSRPLAPYFP